MAKPDKKPESINLTAASTAGENTQTGPLESSIASSIPEISSTAGSLASTGDTLPSTLLTGGSFEGSSNSTAGTHESFTALSDLKIEDTAVGTTSIQEPANTSGLRQTSAEETHQPPTGLSADSITHPKTYAPMPTGIIERIDTSGRTVQDAPATEDIWAQLMSCDDYEDESEKFSIIGAIAEKMREIVALNRESLLLVADLSGHGTDTRVAALASKALQLIATLTPSSAMATVDDQGNPIE